MRNFVSKIFGMLANFHFPGKLQNFINKQYIKAFNIDMSEFKSIENYKSLNELFTRSLIKQRDFSDLRNDFISPSDGMIFECGKSESFKAFSIKGCEYDIKELLSELAPQKKQNFEYANIYLSPKDYHHYHAPCDISVLSALYIPADLYSVAAKVLLKIPRVYEKNERVILKCKMANGALLWLVFVGALNVGKMKFDFDDRIKTNAKNRQISKYDYENLKIKKGEHLGNFELGSTIVIIAENESLKFSCNPGESIKFGQNLAKISNL